MTTHAPAWAERWWLDARQLAFAAEQVVCRDLWRCRLCGAFACPPLVAWARRMPPDEHREPSDLITLCMGCADHHGNRAWAGHTDTPGGRGGK